ncbi:peptide ABC transporter ATPase [Agrilactobacillus composti DSM 18527 = JCM 14202]|uniref:Peptide ABC transporter ATPase n=1 Tax=Agrilactobacillus composti DSM 18527 = JCM 14202 TaxID=1423734 RepID=X0PHW0_9LACO|nr:ABC transporter ATP-binding protein [Agrilactobacillus composti]KRM33559.1 peptide ABC transporter ATPase [Agrilactobacillus composti DSM 18527 = JCM 14202]GAF41613.1 hydroxymethylpyrimidine ABC transporter, ATPase component [Agrilactobacillus composti DSM 18527 = JCM 14202]
MLLQVEHVSKSFDQKTIIKDINLHVAQGEIVSLLGISGSGKTTLFNIIAGLSQPDSGSVLLQDRSILNQPGQVSYMLQKDLLMPYRTVANNVILPLLITGIKKKHALIKAAPLFAEFGLSGYEDKYPADLSGGMRQRAALLRTYLFDKPLALLDEPFSALDAITKRALHTWYLDIMAKIHLSTLLITHDIDEALVLSNRIYVLANTPSVISDEIAIPKALHDASEFELSNEFLQLKRRIIADLHI